MANILVIEDQDSLGSLYQQVLGSIGHDVTIAQTGFAAIAAAETQKPAHGIPGPHASGDESYESSRSINQARRPAGFAVGPVLSHGAIQASSVG